MRGLLLAIVTSASIGMAPSRLMAQTTGSGYAEALSPSLAKVANAMHATIRRDLAEAVESMPADEYAFKPNPDVRSFGQLIGHVVNANTYFCTQVEGRTPAGMVDYEQVEEARS